MAGYGIDLAEYAEYLHEVNATLGINLRKSMNDYLNKKLLPNVKRDTPVSDNLGKEGSPKLDAGDRLRSGKTSGLSIHARDNWKGNVIVDGNIVRVSITNDAPYAEFLEFGSEPGSRPWPNTSSYSEPRTIKKKDPNLDDIHKDQGIIGPRIWAGGRYPGFESTVGGPVARALIDYTGRKGFSRGAKGFTADKNIADLIEEVRSALSAERTTRKHRQKAGE